MTPDKKFYNTYSKHETNPYLEPLALRLKENTIFSELLLFLISILEKKPKKLSDLAEDTKSLLKVKQEDKPNAIQYLDKAFDTIKAQSQEFTKLPSNNPNIIIYADPFDPGNEKKWITYKYNGHSWDIIAGSEADAIIPNKKNKSLVCVSKGKIKHYGNASQHFTLKTESSSGSENLGRVNSKLNAEYTRVMQEVLGLHELHTYLVSPDKRNSFDRKVEAFAKNGCNSTTSGLYGNIIDFLKENQYYDIPGTLPYKDKDGKWHIVRQAPNGDQICLRYNTSGESVEILLPDDIKSNAYHSVILRHNKKPTKDNDGFLGAQILNFDLEKRTCDISKNSNITDPSLSQKIQKVTRKEFENYIQNAKDAAAKFIGNPEETKNFQQLAKQTITKQQQQTKKSALAKLQEQRALNASSDLPDNIKVTAINGADIFELQCPPFKETGCLDGDYNQCESMVYVLKIKGSKFNKNDGKKDKSNALIIEVSTGADGQEAGKIRLRSGYGDSIGFVQAKVNVTHEGKSYTAEMTDSENFINHIFYDDKNNVIGKRIDYDNSGDLSSSPFRFAGRHDFMCVDSCCSHYSNENKQHMKNPSLAKGITIQ